MKKIILTLLSFGLISMGFSGDEETGLKAKSMDGKKAIEKKEQTMTTDPGKVLSDDEIKAVKERAKNFEITSVTADDIAVLETSKGTMKIKFFPDVAPKHCDNFKKLANSGFYDGTLFHRVIPNFMIQGGDINSRDGNPSNDGMGSPGWNVPAEFNKKKHEKGILSMARSQDPNSAGSQFFICATRTAHLDNNYTVFGEVIENLDVIDTIVNVPRDKRDKPLEPVRILKVRVYSGDEMKDASKVK